MKKQEAKTLGDAVGMPDEVDKENIRAYIRKYDKAQPGKLAFTISSARAEHNSARHDDFNLVNKDSGARHIFELPADFVEGLEEAYPIMFRDKKHFRWFVKNFKELMLPKKY